MSTIVVFNGSPRPGGFTKQLLDEAVWSAEKKGAKIIRYNLNDRDIWGCQGCYYCRKNEGCSIKNDALAPMYKDIQEADAVLFGSPIYFYQITGQAKTWLDRMFPMINSDFSPRYPGKRIGTVFVQGADDGSENADVIQAFHRYMAAFGWELSGSILCTGTEHPEYALSKELLAQAHALGEALAGQ